MPRTARTPPPSTPTKDMEVLSDPDLAMPGIPTKAKSRKATRTKDSSNDTFEELKSMMSSWKADQETALKKLAADVAELKVQNQKIQQSNTEIINSMHFINNNYEELKKKVEEFEKEKKNLHECILHLEKKIQDFQFVTRCSSIEIRNIPKNEKETNTDLISVITGIGTAMKVNISSADLRDVYRIPGKNDANRPIVAEFNTVKKKSTLLSAVKDYNRNRSVEDKLNTEIIGIAGSRQSVFIAEFLPPSTRRLFYIARNFAKVNNFTFCWVSNNRVFLRKEAGAKQIPILSENCLKKLQPCQ